MDQLWFMLFLLKATFSVQAIEEKECVKLMTTKYNQMPSECKKLSACTLRLTNPSIEYTCFSNDNYIHRPCNRRESFGTYVQASCRPPYFYNESNPTQKTGMTCLLNGEWSNDLGVPEFTCRTAEKFLEEFEEFRVGVQNYRFLLNLAPARHNDTLQDIRSPNLRCAQPRMSNGLPWAWNEGYWKIATKVSYEQIAFKIQCFHGHQLPFGVPSIYYCSHGLWTYPLNSDKCKPACSLDMIYQPNVIFHCFNNDLKLRLCRKYEPVGTQMVATCAKGYDMHSETMQIRICNSVLEWEWTKRDIKDIKCVKYNE